MTRYCPYCRAPLYQRRDKSGRYMYRCAGCQRVYSLREATRLPRQAIKLRNILRDAEKAYEKALEILSNLDKRQNRLIIANMLVRADYTDVKEVDFEGAKLDPLSHRKPELSSRYGVRIYPMTLIIHPQRMERVKAKIYGKEGSESVKGTCVVQVKDYPFGKLGGLRLSFNPKMGDRSTAEHEDLHGTFHIYRGWGDEEYTLEEAREAILLNEINSFRSGMQYNYMETGERHEFEKFWYNVEETLVRKYVPRMIKRIEDENQRKAERKRLVEMIDEMINIMIELQLEYDEIVITHVLLKAKNFEQLKWWVKRKNVLDEWHKRAIRGRENEIKKQIVVKMNFMTPIGDIKNDIYNRVGEYWRFKGKFDDHDARWKHVNRLIEDALKSADDDVKNYYHKGGEEGKKGLEELAKGVKEEGEKEGDVGKKGLEELAKGVKGEGEGDDVGKKGLETLRDKVRGAGKKKVKIVIKKKNK